MARNLLEAIKYFVPLVNREIGREDCNEFSVTYFTALIGTAFFDYGKDWYLCALPCPNPWGDMTLCVVSFWICPAKRNNPLYLRRILRKLRVFAKISGARYIEIGSHINNKLHDFFIRLGYEVSAVKGVVKWE